MSSFFNLDENSSDSADDLDYVPEGQLSENDITDGESVPSSDDETLGAQRRKLGAGKRSAKRKKRGEKTEENKNNSEEIKDNLIDKKIEADKVWKSFLTEVAETHESTSNDKSPESSSLEKSNKNIGISLDEANAPPLIKTCEFEGETVSSSENSSNVDIVSSEASISGSVTTFAQKDVPASPVKRKGLQSVLGTLMNKKQKITTLQKSLIDWKTYKKDEGIEEELEKFNKGKGGFIERQKFLERSDLRSYEFERDLRLSKLKKS